MFIEIKSIPIPICGLILSFFSLGNIYRKYFPFFRGICFICGLFLFILMTLKIIFYPKLIKEQLKNHILASVSGTYSMGLMSFSLYFLNYSYNLTLFIWSLGILP